MIDQTLRAWKATATRADGVLQLLEKGWSSLALLASMPGLKLRHASSRNCEVAGPGTVRVGCAIWWTKCSDSGKQSLVHWFHIHYPAILPTALQGGTLLKPLTVPAVDSGVASFHPPPTGFSGPLLLAASSQACCHTGFKPEARFELEASRRPHLPTWSGLWPAWSLLAPCQGLALPPRAPYVSGAVPFTLFVLNCCVLIYCSIWSGVLNTN